MQKTLAEIAKIVDGEVVGDKNFLITGISGIKEAKKGDLTFVANSKYIVLTKKSKASAFLISQELEIPLKSKSYIRTQNPSLAFAKAADVFYKKEDLKIIGIHPTAIISENVKLGKGVAVGPYAIIEAEAQIADNTIIHGNCYIGHAAKIGKNCFIYPLTVIRDKSIIGNHVIIHSGSVIGSDGFGYEPVEGKHEKISQLGNVVIEDYVEIGSNVTIDRARFDKTLIGEGTKIDNLVQIAHNVVIGKNCLIVAQVGISGSTVIEDNCIIAGQAGVAGHLTIGKGSVVTAQSGVTHSIPPKSKVIGFPAKPHHEAKRVNACVQRLPIYVDIIRKLEKKVEELEKKLKNAK